MDNEKGGILPIADAARPRFLRTRCLGLAGEEVAATLWHTSVALYSPPVTCLSARAAPRRAEKRARARRHQRPAKRWQQTIAAACGSSKNQRRLLRVSDNARRTTPLWLGVSRFAGAAANAARLCWTLKACALRDAAWCCGSPLMVGAVRHNVFDVCRAGERHGKHLRFILTRRHVLVHFGVWRTGGIRRCWRSSLSVPYAGILPPCSHKRLYMA
jgi:hypothetical protein